MTTQEVALDFQIEIIESNPGANPLFQAQKIIVNVPDGSLGFTVEGRTCGRDGCSIRVFDQHKQEMMSKSYSAFMGIPIPIMEISHDVWEVMNILVGEDNELSFSPEDIYPAINEMVDKCESRYGAYIPNSDFESQIVF